MYVYVRMCVCVCMHMDMDEYGYVELHANTNLYTRRRSSEPCVELTHSSTDEVRANTLSATQWSAARMVCILM